MTQQRNGKSAVERAFEMAASGEVESVERLGQALSLEGYSTAVLTGPTLLKQLRGLIAAQRQDDSAKT